MNTNKNSIRGRQFSVPYGNSSNTPLQKRVMSLHEKLDGIEMQYEPTPSPLPASLSQERDDLSLRSLMQLAKEIGVRITIEPVPHS